MFGMAVQRGRSPCGRMSRRGAIAPRAHTARIHVMANPPANKLVKKLANQPAKLQRSVG